MFSLSKYCLRYFAEKPEHLPHLDNFPEDIRQLLLRDLLDLNKDGLANNLQKFLVDGLVYLDLNKCKKIKDTHFSHFPCSSLRVLSLRQCELVSNECIKSIIRRASNIQVLNLSGCGFLQNDALEEISMQLSTKLIDLQVSGCYLVSNLGLKAIAQRCTNLSVISLARCTQINDGLEEIAENCTKLVSVDLYLCKEIRSEPIITLAKNSATNLRFLYLSECKKVNQSAIYALASFCTNLENLYLNGITAIDGKSLFELAKTCTGLKRLELSSGSASDLAVSTIARCCSEIQSLRLDGSTQLTADSLKLLTSTNIQSLSLKHCAVTDECLKGFSNCINLNFLKLDVCTRISDRGLKEIANKCHKLTGLLLNACDRITDASLQLIASNCSSLEVLELDRTRWNLTTISDSTISLFAKNNPKLKKISLQRCQKLTDLSIFDLVDNCHELFKIDVSYSTTLTTASIYHIQRNSTQLKKLHLDGLKSVDDSCILELMKMPKIKSIFAADCQNVSTGVLDQLKKFRWLKKHQRKLEMQKEVNK